VILGVAQGLILLRIVSIASKDCFKKYGLVLGGFKCVEAVLGVISKVFGRLFRF
jgi:hypothetical protein